MEDNRSSTLTALIPSGRKCKYNKFNDNNMNINMNLQIYIYIYLSALCEFVIWFVSTRSPHNVQARAHTHKLRLLLHNNVAFINNDLKSQIKRGKKRYGEADRSRGRAPD